MLAIQQCFHLNLFPAFLYDTVPPAEYFCGGNEALRSL